MITAIGDNAKIKLFGFGGTTLHLSGLSGTWPSDERNNHKMAYVLSNIMNIDIKPGYIERPVGKMIDIQTNKFLPAPYSYVYVPDIVTAEQTRLK